MASVIASLLSQSLSQDPVSNFPRLNSKGDLTGALTGPTVRPLYGAIGYRHTLLHSTFEVSQCIAPPPPPNALSQPRGRRGRGCHNSSCPLEQQSKQVTYMFLRLELCRPPINPQLSQRQMGLPLCKETEYLDAGKS